MKTIFFVTLVLACSLIKAAAQTISIDALSNDAYLLRANDYNTNMGVIRSESSNIIFVGDIYDTSWHPTFYAGGLAGFVSAIEAILAVSDEKTLIIPGHGEHTGKLELQRYKENTLLWVERVKELNKAGKSVAQMIQDDQLNKILCTFNQNSSAELPERAVERFIERTLQVLERES